MSDSRQSRKRYLIPTLGFGLILMSYANCAKLQYDGQPAPVETIAKQSEMVYVDGACPSGRVPIGVTSQMEVQCASTHGFSSAQVCPKDYYLYSVSATENKVTCLKIWELTREGSICPVNHYLKGYTLKGQVICDVMPGVPPEHLCEAGYYYRGLNGNTALCELIPDSVGTLPNQCSQGKYLHRLESGELRCEPYDWHNFSQAHCASGEALIGLASGQYICQSLQNKRTAPQETCGDSQMVLRANSSGALDCRSDVQLDFVRFCGNGYYLSRITEYGFDCSPLPDVDTRFNGTCAPGAYLNGFQNNEAVCVEREPFGELPGFCPNGSFPVGLTNGQLICREFAWLRGEKGKSCTPYATEVCSASNGIGYRGCYSDGSGWSQCVPSICNGGYELVNGQCKEITCAPGSSTVCSVPYGTGIRYCRSDGKGFETTCQVQTCTSPYRLQNNQCVTEL